MANGSKVQTVKRPLAGEAMLYEMLKDKGNGETDLGTWVDARLIKQASLEMIGTGTVSSFTAKLMGSNALAQPSDATDGFQIGSDITTQGVVAVALLCRWYKVKLTAISTSGGGKLNSLLHGITY
jgi:hypothetical protein